MSIIAFIPARAGSKSIPNKNIRELGGKPLIAWTIETALASGLRRVIVNTDGEEIAKVARQYGAEVMMRPTELAQDTTSMFEVIRNEIPKIEPRPELVLLLQPTSPFRKKVYIKTAITSMVASLDQYDSLISVERVPEKFNPAQVIVSTPLGHRMANGSPISQRVTRRQEFPEAYTPTGSIYLFKTGNLETGSLYGTRVMLLETESDININGPEDWAIAEAKVQPSRPIVSASKVMHIAEGGICESCE